MAKFRFVSWLFDYINSRSSIIFEWDDANCTKSLSKHGVDNDMVESVFHDRNLLALGEQYQPITHEVRYGIIGKSYTGEIIFICFTIREQKIRPISSRFANQKERRLYEKEVC